MPKKLKVVFVCLGNICRSPTADAVMRAKVRAAGLEGCIEVDSCGTAGYHEGSAPDRRSARVAELNGYRMQGIVSRPLSSADYAQADYLLAMDSNNLRDLQQGMPAAGSSAVISLLMGYADIGAGVEVPDPYYGGEQGFDNVLAMIESACDGLLRQIQKRLTEG